MIGTGGRVAGALGHLAKDGKLIGPAGKTGDLSPPPTQLEISFFVPAPKLTTSRKEKISSEMSQKLVGKFPNDSTLLLKDFPNAKKMNNKKEKYNTTNC